MTPMATRPLRPNPSGSGPRRRDPLATDPYGPDRSGRDDRRLGDAADRRPRRRLLLRAAPGPVRRVAPPRTGRVAGPPRDQRCGEVDASPPRLRARPTVLGVHHLRGA